MLSFSFSDKTVPPAGRKAAWRKLTTYSLSLFSFVLKSSKSLEDLHEGHLSKLVKEAKFQAKRRLNFGLIPIFAPYRTPIFKLDEMY